MSWTRFITIKMLHFRIALAHAYTPEFRWEFEFTVNMQVVLRKIISRHEFFDLEIKIFLIILATVERYPKIIRKLSINYIISTFWYFMADTKPFFNCLLSVLGGHIVMNYRVVKHGTSVPYFNRRENIGFNHNSSINQPMSSTI